MVKLMCLIVVVLLAEFCSKNHTYIIDDQLSNKKHLEQLDSAEIFSYIEWPAGITPPRYEEYKHTTVVVVKTWAYEAQLQKERHALLNAVVDEAEKSNDVLIMFNGIEVTKEELLLLRDLKPGDLKSVSTMKSDAAKNIFGDKAKSTNLNINTYDLSMKIQDIE